eukprot:4828211-Amphidinium_carterae.1
MSYRRDNLRIGCTGHQLGNMEVPGRTKWRRMRQWDSTPHKSDRKSEQHGTPDSAGSSGTKATDMELHCAQPQHMVEHDGAERGAKREALPQPEQELERPAKRTLIVTPDTNPLTEEQRCNAELKEENKKLQLQIQLLTEQVSNLLQKLDALALQSAHPGQGGQPAKAWPQDSRSTQDQWSEYDRRTQQVVHMHRLGELALEAYEQAEQPMLLCRLHWDTVEREVYQQARKWCNPSSEGNLCLWRATLGQLPLDAFQDDQAEK